MGIWAHTIGVVYGNVLHIVVLLRFKQRSCLRGTQQVKPLVALKDFLGALVGERGGTREMKTRGMSETESILAWKRDRLRHTDQCQVLPNMSVMIGGIKN